MPTECVLNCKCIHKLLATLPNIAIGDNFPLDSISLTSFEVESILKSLKIGKASGPDQINHRIVKELAHSLSFQLCDLFNYSLSSGKVPKLWKQANVTPIYKKVTSPKYQIIDLSHF